MTKVSAPTGAFKEKVQTVPLAPMLQPGELGVALKTLAVPPLTWIPTDWVADEIVAGWRSPARSPRWRRGTVIVSRTFVCLRLASLWLRVPPVAPVAAVLPDGTNVPPPLPIP